MSKIFRCDVCGSEPVIANTRETGQFWCETCQTWKDFLIIYTFVLGTNIPQTIKVGDRHSWAQMRPNTGSYGAQHPGGPAKLITGVVVAINDDMWVKVEAEYVPPLEHVRRVR
jgi:hypothetical protein